MAKCKHCGTILSPEEDPTINESAETIEIAGTIIQLTKSEWTIFEILRSRLEKLVDTYFIYDNLYGSYLNDPPATTIIAVHICRVRKKLKGSAYSIRNKFGTGYILSKTNKPVEKSNAPLARPTGPSLDLRN